MEFQTLKLREDGAVLYVTFANPPINLMTGLMVQELFQLTGYLMGNRALKVVVVDSADPVFFIAHFDLDDLTDTQNDPAKASRYPDINGLQSLGLSVEILNEDEEQVAFTEDYIEAIPSLGINLSGREALSLVPQCRRRPFRSTPPIAGHESYPDVHRQRAVRRAE